jgi:pimeloyl-ACP methyl ester carboxylesterase
MGSSLGAILSQEFALQYPEKVIGLILLDGALIQKEPMADWSLRLMQVPFLGEWLYTRLRKNPDAAFESLSNVYHDLGSLPEQDRDFLFRRVNKRVWSDGQRRAYFSTLRSLTKWVKASQDGLQERLRREDIPTLVVRGEFDPLFPVENADAVIEAQTNAEKVIIKNAGHLPHQEAPKVVVNTVKNWLQKFD